MCSKSVAVSPTSNWTPVRNKSLSVEDKKLSWLLVAYFALVVQVLFVPPVELLPKARFIKSCKPTPLSLAIAPADDWILESGSITTLFFSQVFAELIVNSKG